MKHPNIIKYHMSYFIFYNIERFVVGDIGGLTKSQNITDGAEADGRGGILHVTPIDNRIHEHILSSRYPLNLNYGYEIRNSFGIDFDIVSCHLWNTENCPEYCDEINLIKPGFNSGWASDYQLEKYM